MLSGQKIGGISFQFMAYVSHNDPDCSNDHRLLKIYLKNVIGRS